MSLAPQWQGLPYHAISQFYRHRFGGRVYKIPVSISETCPNREGLGGGKICIFCDQWGSAAFPEYSQEPLRRQIEETRTRLQRRFNGEMFLVYFQAYTTTFSRTSHLREQFKTAFSFPDVKGVVVGTRPDCISDAVLDLWNETTGSGRFVGVELGVQSFDEKQLVWMQRGHTGKRAIDSILRIKEKTQVDLGIHLIFGLPGETDDQVIATARLVNSLPINNVKIHNLHVLRNTPLEKIWNDGQFIPLSRESYIRRTILFLEHLRPELSVHRLAAVASRHDELVAPAWASSKMETYQMFLDEFRRQETFQGSKWEAPLILDKNPDIASSNQYLGLNGQILST
jgi:radical SAM protein (TIGR01212 family)